MVKSDVIDLSVYSGPNAVGLVENFFIFLSILAGPQDVFKSPSNSKPLLGEYDYCVQQGTMFKDDFT